MNKLVICGSVPESGKQLFRDRLADKVDMTCVATPEEVETVEGVTYVVLRGGKMPTEIVERLPDSVKLIHRWGVGYDNVDVETAAKKGIYVAICTGGNAEPVAELTMLLMLTCLRKLPALIERARLGTKEKEDIIRSTYLLQGKTLGLVGFGNIGSRVSRAAQAIGANVIYYDAFRMPAEREKACGVTYVPFDELLAQSDIVSIHVPLLDTTRHMFDAQAIAKMKDNAILINTARGPIVDFEALQEALDGGKLLAVGLDTVEGEPLPSDHPIFRNPKVIITPHAGGNTSDNTPNMVEIIVKNILAMEEGGAPEKKYLVNAPQ